MTAAALTLPVAVVAQPSAKEEAEKAGKMLEAYFLRRIMAEVRGSSSAEGSLLAPGFGGQVFREMLDEQLADRMAERGGVGIADMVKKQLTGEIGPSTHASHALALPGSTRAVRSAYGVPPGKAWVMPVDALRISSGFGKVRLDPTRPEGIRTHKGIDMIAPIGTPVMAARGGEVVRAEPSTGGFGNVVVIDHGGGIQSYYGHMSAIEVKKGDHVEVGTLVGKVGSTGRSSAPHLHFEVRRDGVSIDPTSAIEGLKIEGPRTNR